MPVSHSQSLLCVSLSPIDGVLLSTGLARVSNVPYLVRLPAEAPQQEYPLDIIRGDAGQVRSVANPDHLSAARLASSSRTGEVTEIDGLGAGR